MHQFELENFLRKKLNSDSFDVLPFDMLPAKLTKFPFAFIINLDESTLPGSHWVAVTFDKNSDATYFCSYGMKPNNETIQSFLRVNAKSVNYNNKELQQTKSGVCGEYSAVFIVQSMCHHKSLEHFLRHFGPNLTLNDFYIRKIFARLDNFPN